MSKNNIFFKRTSINRKTKSRLSKGTIIDKHSFIEGDNRIGACNIEGSYIGKHSYIGSGYLPLCKIRKFCSISYNVIVQPYTHCLETVSSFPGFL